MLFIPLSSIGEEAKLLISSEPVPPSVNENNAHPWGSLWSKARLVSASAIYVPSTCGQLDSPGLP